MPLRELRERLERVASGASSLNAPLVHAFLSDRGARQASQAISQAFSQGGRDPLYLRSQDVPFQE